MESRADLEEPRYDRLVFPDREGFPRVEMREEICERIELRAEGEDRLGDGLRRGEKWSN